VAQNTRANIETLGMLVGALSGSELVVTAVLVPNQRGSSDMCEMTNEEEIWEHIDQDQINLGWVHTHPTQTSFMSSIDLHIHMPYQMLLDESIAIVLSPKHLPSCRVFRLCHPNPPGLREVQECHMSKPELRNRHHPDHKRGDSSEPGAHGDPRGAVYEEAPHVRFDPQRNVKLVDLRR
jgi:STAM-binding protein